MSIKEFVQLYGEKDSLYSEMLQVKNQFEYWALCGYADMDDCVTKLDVEDRKDLLRFLVKNDYCAGNTMSSSANTKVAISIINSL